MGFGETLSASGAARHKFGLYSRVPTKQRYGLHGWQVGDTVAVGLRANKTHFTNNAFALVTSLRCLYERNNTARKFEPIE